MENAENMILDVLNDPEKLSQVMDIAKNLGFSPPGEEPPAAPEAENLNMGAMLSMLQSMGSQEPQQEALIRALLPYLRPERQKKLQKAMRLAKLSNLAGVALKNYADKPEGR